MTVQTKIRPDDTRARIMETAETLFRRLGFAKTAVADIAAELRMSPANIYRFFPSKTAIVQAMCQRCLNELEEKIWQIARSRGPASQRLERLELEVLAYHKENLLVDQRVSDIVEVAMEESWDAIVAHRHRADPAGRYRSGRVRDGGAEGNLAADHEGIRWLLPPDPARAERSGRPGPRNRGQFVDPLLAARHHPPKVNGHVQIPARRTATKK